MKTRFAQACVLAALAALGCAGCQRATIAVRDAQTHEPVTGCSVRVNTTKVDAPFVTWVKTDSRGRAPVDCPRGPLHLYVVVHPSDGGPDVSNDVFLTSSEWKPLHGPWQDHAAEAPRLEVRFESPAEAKP